jgi:hypothetical protein
MFARDEKVDEQDVNPIPEGGFHLLCKLGHRGRSVFVAGGDNLDDGH